MSARLRLVNWLIRKPMIVRELILVPLFPAYVARSAWWGAKNGARFWVWEHQRVKNLAEIEREMQEAENDG